MSTLEAKTATALVTRAKDGDQGAYSELVRRYRPRIVALALHLTGSSGDAEDIAQDVFIKAFEKLDTFEGRSHFFTWIYRMAVNRSLNVKRSVSRRKEDHYEDPRIGRAVAIDSGGDPEREATLRRTYRKLLRSLDRLPGPMRTSVVLVALQGLSHEEAAVVQQCAPGTVAWRIHESRKRLRQSLARAERDASARNSREPRLSGDFVRLLREWALPVVAPST